MTPKLVADTDVISYIFKQDTRSPIYRPFFATHDVAISFMTVAELELWAARHDWGPRRTELLRHRLDELIVVHSSIALARRWTQVIESSRNAGVTISFSDAWIAATAIELECPLLTGNGKDYRHLAALELLP